MNSPSYENNYSLNKEDESINSKKKDITEIFVNELITFLDSGKSFSDFTATIDGQSKLIDFFLRGNPSNKKVISWIEDDFKALHRHYSFYYFFDDEIEKTEIKEHIYLKIEKIKKRIAYIEGNNPSTLILERYLPHYVYLLNKYQREVVTPTSLDFLNDFKPKN